MLDLSTLSTQKTESFIKDTTTDAFEQDVLMTSMTTPVIVDFWAPWCGPCKQLMPMLEKVVAGAKGAVQLIKVNIDEEPTLAQALRIQSVPTVYVFFQGKPVDGFQGVRPESELKAMVDRLVQMTGGQDNDTAVNIDDLLKTADGFFADQNYMEAIAAYSTALDQAPEDMRAMAGIAWCFVAQHDKEALSAVLEDLTDTQKADPAIKGLVYIADQNVDGILDRVTIEGAVAKNANDHIHRFMLAQHKLADLDILGAVDDILTITRVDREWENQKARAWLLKLFDALGTSHPVTIAGRRQLSSILFS